MELDYTGMKFYLDLAQVLITLGVGIYVWISNRHRVTEARIAKLEREMDDRLDGLGERMARQEERAGSGPSHEDLQAVYRRLDDVNGVLSELRGDYKGMRSTLDLIHEYLLNKR